MNIRVTRGRVLVVVAAIILGLVGGRLHHAYSMKLPTLTPVAQAMGASKTGSPNITWSPYGEQSITVVGHPELTQSYGAAGALPTASIAKVLTALVILKDKPLSVGQQGPNIPINAAQVAVYQQDLAENQSVVQVTAGEQMSEYQALEAMLVPSATNIADIAAAWDFGSIDKYLSVANQFAATNGLSGTHLADASGFNPGTTSTPQDLIKLGEMALQNPVIAQIVAQPSVTLPVVGAVQNFNTALGQLGINGIKTGNTDQAGGALLFSAKYNGMVVVGVILGAPDLGTALHDAPEVLSSYEENLATSTPLKAGAVVGTYKVPWGGTVQATAQNDLSMLGWSGTRLTPNITLNPIKATQKSSEPVGSASITSNGNTQTTPVVLAHSVPQPGLWWRLTH